MIDNMVSVMMFIYSRIKIHNDNITQIDFKLNIKTLTISVILKRNEKLRTFNIDYNASLHSIYDKIESEYIKICG